MRNRRGAGRRNRNAVDSAAVAAAVAPRSVRNPSSPTVIGSIWAC